MSKWVKSESGPDVAVKFTRLHPLQRRKNLPPSAVVGNVPGHPGSHTDCPMCRHAVVERVGFTVRKLELKNAKCGFCREPVAGLWA